MAFCSNCGHELIDGVKFCTVCGTPTDKSNSLGMNTSANNEVQMRYQQQPQVTRHTEAPKSTYENPLKKKSGRIYAVILFILAGYLFLANSTAVVILLSIGIIAGAIICFKKGYKFKLLTALALITAAFALFVTCWQIVDSSKSKDEDKYAYETESKKADDISTSSNNTAQTSTAKNSSNAKPTKNEADTTVTETIKTENPTDNKEAIAEKKTEEAQPVPEEETKTVAEEETQPETKEETTSNNGVDPDLKAFLDSYEAYIDEYVEFMKKYSADPGNAVSMMDDYTKMMKKYADFADKINKYDTKTMSKADLEYYLDVTNRCSKKMLSVY